MISQVESLAHGQGGRVSHLRDQRIHVVRVQLAKHGEWE